MDALLLGFPFSDLVTNLFAMQRLHLIGKLDSQTTPPFKLEVPSFFHQDTFVQTDNEITDGVKMNIAWGGDRVKAWSLGRTERRRRIM